MAIAIMQVDENCSGGISSSHVQMEAAEIKLSIGHHRSRFKTVWTLKQRSTQRKSHH